MKVPARDTIVAVSSSTAPQYHAAREHTDLPRAIIRLSGVNALEYAARVFSPTDTTEKQKSLSAITGWRRVAGEVRWKTHAFAVHAYVMRSPRSYTREDIAELHVPSLPWLISTLLEELLAAGARLAQPGEFTRRAFENGRISIEQAEAVGALIASRTADEARVHAQRLRSQRTGHGQSLRSEIEDLLSLVELGLDFSHEDVGVLKPQEILARLNALKARVETFAGISTDSPANTEDTAVLNTGLPRILLLGPTNAGKSSLFNRLIGRDAAIVSSERHTTRDTLEAVINFDSAGQALLVDTAGFGSDITPAAAESSSANWLRQAAWNATLAAVKSADVIVLALDRSADIHDQPETSFFSEVLMRAKPSALAIVHTKSDLPSSNSAIQIAANLNIAQRFDVSSVTCAGIDALSAFLREQIAALGSRPRDAGLAAAATARNAARTAAAALARASEGLSAGHGEDVVAVELREAIHAFWQAEGILLRHDAVTESTLDRIFSKFCIGK